MSQLDIRIETDGADATAIDADGVILAKGKSDDLLPLIGRASAKKKEKKTKSS